MFTFSIQLLLDRNAFDLKMIQYLELMVIVCVFFEHLNFFFMMTDIDRVKQ